jgi:uncharacterized protein with von Willebrand factor type A (vWA) domain
MADVSQKKEALDQAIEIAKNFGRGGATTNPDSVIENAYRKIVELMDDSDKVA